VPRFTVICPTYNRGPAIASTLDSVRRQSLRDWELIVASDASDDGTDAVVEDVARADPRIRLLRTRRFGSQSGPTNLALREASGGLIAYLDHDDRWDAGHLELMAAAFDGGADFVGTRTRRVDESGTVLGFAHPLSLCWHPELQLMSPLFENSCAAHRAGLAEQVGGWRESPHGLEDWDLWLRMADAGVRCTTVLDCTVAVLEAPHTRQNTLGCPHRHEIARFADARAARAAWRALNDTRYHAAELEAARRDVTGWYVRLADEGALVFPWGWCGGPAGLPAAVDDHLRESGHLGRGLVIERRDDGFSLAFVLSTMTAEHADRYAAFFRSTMTHQMEHLADVLPAASVVL
jgi:glycosyltransferase involved in cell wall biosynthesis